MSYQPPASAKPFTLNISDSDLEEFTTLLKLSKLGPKTWESSQEDGRFGTTRQWLADAKDHWLNKYDWRAQEKYINSFPNYTMQVEDMSIHFVALFSEKKDAVPILFMHGWPGSFIEFLPMCELLKKKYGGKELPYHVIVPSLPGYTLSEGGPLDRDWTMSDTSRVMDKLMKELGFEKYLAQGGDVGSFVAHELAVAYEGCVGVHCTSLSFPYEFSKSTLLNMIRFSKLPDTTKLSEDEQMALGKAKDWNEKGTGYALEHGTRPSTIGLVLSSNPLALLAWIGEKFLEWSDQHPVSGPPTTPSLDTILTNVCLYWFTQSFPRSIYPYRALFGGSRSEVPYISKPLGFSFFPQEISPGLRPMLEAAGELVLYKHHEVGGHFAALECPTELLEDVEEFVAKIWKDGGVPDAKSLKL